MLDQVLNSLKPHCIEEKRKVSFKSQEGETQRTHNPIPDTCELNIPSVN